MSWGEGWRCWASSCDRGRGEKNEEKEGGAVATAAILNWRVEVGPDRPTDSARPNWGGGRGLTGGPWPQCRAAVLADRRTQASQCRV
jgi:hypothetical protein